MSRMCHRDIKLENILVYSNDASETSIKFIDFNFVAPVEIGKPAQVKGSSMYLAPELLSDRFKFLDCFATDIWASGITLFAFFHKKFPFLTSDGILNEHRLGLLKESVARGDALDDLLFKLLQKDPRKRITIDQILSHPWITKSSKGYKFSSKKTREKSFVSGGSHRR